MDTILITVTVLSLALAATFGVLLARRVREERRRSDARVELLMDLASPGDSKPERAPRFADFDLGTPERSAVASGDLFQDRDEPRAWPRRVFAAGAVAMTIGALVLVWHATDRTSASPAPAATVAVHRPLELLSLSHQQQGGTLVVSGLVQNPRSASVVSGVQATVLVFDADGALLASARAPLDFTNLAPGDESPFVVRVAAAGVARYRIGFRGPHDETLAHVDRRSPDTLARKETP